MRFQGISCDQNPRLIARVTARTDIDEARTAAERLAGATGDAGQIDTVRGHLHGARVVAVGRRGPPHLRLLVHVVALCAVGRCYRSGM